jgi:hypothetical protein
MVTVVTCIVIMLPLVVWVQRLKHLGVITDERPLDRVIRKRLTGKPARLSAPDYHHARPRYYRTVFLAAPIATAAGAAIIAALRQPHNALGLVMAPALLSAVFVLLISEDRFTNVSSRRRVTCASLSGLLAATAATAIVSAVDPHAVLAYGAA